MKGPRIVLPVLLLAVLAVGASPRHEKMEDACFYFPDGTSLHLKIQKAPDRDDALAVQSALIETAKDHRSKVMRGESPATGFEDRMVLSAMVGDWTEGGLSCRYAWARSGGRAYFCTCDAAGGGCTRVVMK